MVAIPIGTAQRKSGAIMICGFGGGGGSRKPPIIAGDEAGGHVARLPTGFKEETMAELNNSKAVGLLNRILEAELAGVVRYTHYSLLVFGFNRIPIVAWLREQAAELLTHAQQAGEMITHLGDYPSLTIGPLLDTHRTDVGTILRESLESEARALALYRELLATVEGKSVMLEEYARQMVQAEELHAGEVDKMLRQPGEVAAFRPEAGHPV